MERSKPLDEQESKAPSKTKGNSDAELVSMMGMAMLNQGGLKVIEDALKSSQEPGQVVGNFLAQMVGQLAEFTQANMGIDPGVFVAENGFLDQILDYIERKLKLPREFSDQVYGEAMEVMKAAAMGEQNADAQGPQAGPAPAGPAPQGPPQGGRPGLDGGM